MTLLPSPISSDQQMGMPLITSMALVVPTGVGSAESFGTARMEGGYQVYVITTPSLQPRITSVSIQDDPEELVALSSRETVVSISPRSSSWTSTPGRPRN
jgi:hypothetical protein